MGTDGTGSVGPTTNPLAELVGIQPSVLAELLDQLRERGETVATAESITAGLLCAVLTSVPGSSAVVRGGLVVYASDLKSGLAGVDPDLLARHGAVHPEVAGRLAEGARERCAATWGVGLTGVAGPGPQDGVPQGVVYVALAGPGAAPEVRAPRLTGDRHEIRQEAVRAAVNLLVERAARRRAREQ